MKIKIDKNIPTPNSWRRKKHDIHVPWIEMEIGDSVFIKSSNPKAVNSIKSLACYYGVKHDCIYTIRTYYGWNENQRTLEGIRIWKTNIEE